MNESRISRVAVRKVAEAVLDCLPPTSDPNELSVEEAMFIGKKIYPGWVHALMFCETDHQRKIAETCFEMIGRGFMYAAPRALPEWLQDVWGLKEKNAPDMLEKVCDVILNVPDPEKHAAYWYLYACGWTCEDVIVQFTADLENKAAGKGPLRLVELDELENL